MPRKAKETGLFDMGFRRRKSDGWHPLSGTPPPPPPKRRTAVDEATLSSPLKRGQKPGERRKPKTLAQLERERYEEGVRALGREPKTQAELDAAWEKFKPRGQKGKQPQPEEPALPKRPLLERPKRKRRLPGYPP